MSIFRIALFPCYIIVFVYVAALWLSSSLYDRGIPVCPGFS